MIEAPNITSSQSPDPGVRRAYRLKREAEGKTISSVAAAREHIEKIRGRSARLEESLKVKDTSAVALLEAVEEKLWLVLQAIDVPTIVTMSARDLTGLGSMLFEKRSLLRGEPTQIVRSEHGALDKVMALLIEESRKRKLARGVAEAELEGQFKRIDPPTDDQ